MNFAVFEIRHLMTANSSNNESILYYPWNVCRRRRSNIFHYLEKYNGEIPYIIVLEQVTTYSFFDNFFKVRDRYETYIDTATMLPVKFVRNVDEGGSKIYNNVTFNHKAGTAVSTNGVFKITSCIQDVISSAILCTKYQF